MHKCVCCGAETDEQAPEGLCNECLQSSDEPSTVPAPTAQFPAVQLKQGLELSQFTLRSRLGTGGMGEVWLAVDNRLSRPGEQPCLVALKFLAPWLSADSGARERLRQEVLKGRELSHENIVRIYSWHEEPQEPVFFAMEYVRGQSLATRLARSKGRRFTWLQLAPLAKQLCEALSYAHSREIVHRDIKPGNILVTADGAVKLADFGLARLSSVKGSLTVPVSRGGTEGYMSPQQAEGKPPTESDDLFSLGATLYELLTGTRPYLSGDGIPALGELMRNFPPQEGRPLPSVQDVIMACLAEKPGERPSSVDEVSRRLGFYSSFEEERSFQPNPRREPSESAGKAERGIKPGRLRTMALAVIAMALPFGVVFFIWSRQPANPTLAPANDSFHKPQSLTGPTVANKADRRVYTYTATGTTVGATAEPGENAEFGRTVWYQLTLTDAGDLSVDSGADHAVSLLKGLDLASLETVEPRSRLGLTITSPVTADTRYLIQVDGGPGSFTLDVRHVVVLPDLGSRTNRTNDSGSNTHHRPSVTQRYDPSRKIWTNSLGMEFLVVPELPGRLSRWETRVRDFEEFLTENPRLRQRLTFNQTTNDPVVQVSWNDATNFCHWLTLRERRKGAPSDLMYRLPTVEEWLLALKAFKPSASKLGNLASRELSERRPSLSFPRAVLRYADDFPFTAPVGKFGVVTDGICDLIGNVWEYCEGTAGRKIAMGGAWDTELESSTIEYRLEVPSATAARDNLGFRCLMVEEPQPKATESQTSLK